MGIEYIEAVDVGSAFAGMGLFILFVVVAVTIARAFEKRASYQYRKYLTNLYVSSKIREMAKKDNLDLTKEEVEFSKYVSLSKKDRIRDLDDQIEVELADKIQNKDKKQSKENLPKEESPK